MATLFGSKKWKALLDEEAKEQAREKAQETGTASPSLEAQESTSDTVVTEKGAAPRRSGEPA